MGSTVDEFAERAAPRSLLLASIIFSTIQIQDVPDQEENIIRNRRTLPVVIGDKPPCRSIAVLLPVRSLVASAFWQSGLISYRLPLTIGTSFAKRILCDRGKAEDITKSKL